MSKKVFISHSIKNKDIADKLVDLLETGVGITDSDIFCSSLEGMGIPSGTNFVEFIRTQIKEPKVVILLISREYLKSQFCLAELGATWVLSHRFIPILISPLEFKDVKAVLTGIQLIKLDDPDGLNQMQEDIVTTLAINGKAFARWESKRNAFIKNINEIIANTHIVEDKVSFEDYKKIETNYKDAVNEIAQMEDEISNQKKLIDSLKKAKDSKDVNLILEDTSNDIQKFNNLVSKIKLKMGELPDIVREAVYKFQRSELLPYPDYGEDYKSQQIHDAVDDDYLYDNGTGLELIDEDPTIYEVLKSLDKLKKHMQKMDSKSTDFYNYYLNTYDHRPNLKSRRFWDEHLF